MNPILRLPLFASLLLASLAAGAQQTTLTREQMAENTENAAVKYFCEIEPQAMTCMGVDPRVDPTKCEALVRQASVGCKARMVQEMPSQMTPAEVKKTMTNFTVCVSADIVTRQGKKPKEVNECFGARKRSGK